VRPDDSYDHVTGRTSKAMSKSSKSVASASREKSRKGPAVFNENIVLSYLAKLEAALGDDRAFTPIFETLRADSAVHQAEAVALATKFVAKTPDSTPRSKALERVWKRHSSLASFRLKQRAMAGRSAA
jgi:hypothetical protein